MARFPLLPVTGFFCVLLGSTASADERAFTFTYETTTIPAGQLEYEQWFTWKTHKRNDKAFDRLDFRHELEYGVTERFQLAAYFDWRYQDGRSVSDNTTEFRDVALEGIYSLTNPVTDVLGSALYGEVKYGDELIELEAKVLLQKNFGNWITAWNGTLEAEWEDHDYSEDKGKLEQTLGVSYQVNPHLSFGGEFLHELEYEDWSEWQKPAIYVGPNASVRTGNWWATLTQLFQTTSRDGEPDFQTRLIFGFRF